MTEQEAEMADRHITLTLVDHWDNELAIRNVVGHYNALAAFNTDLKKIVPNLTPFEFQEALNCLRPADRKELLMNYRNTLEQTKGIVLQFGEPLPENREHHHDREEDNEILPIAKALRTKIAKVLIYVFIPCSLFVAGNILYKAIQHGDINDASDLIKVIIEALGAVLKLALG